MLLLVSSAATSEVENCHNAVGECDAIDLAAIQLFSLTVACNSTIILTTFPTPRCIAIYHTAALYHLA